MGGKKSNKKASGGGKAKPNTKDASKKDNNSQQNEKASKPVKNAHKLKISHLLYEKCSVKDEALAKIQSGVHFSKVPTSVENNGLKPSDKIDLGWKMKSDLLPDFWKVANECEASSDANPRVREAKTRFGYHLIMVHDRK